MRQPNEFANEQPQVAVNDISVLALNVFHEGYTFKSAGISPAAGVGNVIIKSMADIVALPEIDDKVFFDQLLNYLNAADGDPDIDFHGTMSGSTATVSKYALLETASNGAAGGARSIVDLDGNGQVSDGDLLFDGIHANYTNYANYLPRGYYPGSNWGPYAGKGWSAMGPDGQPLPVTDPEHISAVNLNSGRTEALRDVAEVAEDYSGLTSIIAGDFNEPSHLDWTEDAKNLFDHNGVAYEWDTSKLLAEAGYIDSFREMFPDEVANPGFTWVTPVETGNHNVSWTPLADERDRIDFIYHREGENQSARVVESQLFGTDDFVVRNQNVEQGSGSDVALDIGEPWFTDHSGVITRYEILTPSETQSAGPGGIYQGGRRGDMISGSAGDDLQYGGAGNDRIVSSGGADWMFGGSGDDTANYGDATGSIWLTLDGNAGRGDVATGDRLFGIENVVGGQRNDRIAGDARANDLYGSAGDDRLSGGNGMDRLDGGSDDDRLDGGDGRDFLIGGSGHDWLVGGGGRDHLAGGTGIDVMWGGKGRDTFRFETAADSTAIGRDSIIDFSARERDKIDLSQIDADGIATNGDQRFAFIGDDMFSGVRGQLRAVTEADSLRIDADIDGNGSADFAILLAGVSAIGSNDFLL